MLFTVNWSSWAAWHPCELAAHLGVVSVTHWGKRHLAGEAEFSQGIDLTVFLLSPCMPFVRFSSLTSFHLQSTLFFLLFARSMTALNE